MKWLDDLAVLKLDAGLDPLMSTHITSPGYEHMANLTEHIAPGRGRALAMIPKAWSDYLAALDNAAPRLLAIARAAAALEAQLELIHNNERYKSVWVHYRIHGGKYDGPTYEVEIAALRAALAEPERNPERKWGVAILQCGTCKTLVKSEYWDGACPDCGNGTVNEVAEPERGGK